MNVKLPQNANEFKDFQSKIDSLEGEDKRLIDDFVGENALAMAVGNVPSDMTVGDAIIMQKEQEDRAKAKQDAKQGALKAMNDVIGVEYIYHSKFQAAGHSAYKFTVEMTNKQDKQVIAVKGRLIFKDVFGEDVGNIGIESKSTLDKDQPTYAEATSIPFIVQGDSFKDGAYDATDVRFEPEVIVFADKTRISSENS
ncbi:hypothetical protein [Psychrobacter sp. APC 3350]|uniref:hypothetical protein n=1 Tax=Psychrobacter sp. APC 3350 TaxID=3035195 RepID=UPI0025B58747|nr:hypothetical protein [Psychrobacter sp. APC 3350]MDN3453484.1 hypothetical protein [Psychrobacter sp. APC 3350]